MKYMTTGNYRTHLLMRLTLACTLVFLTAFWVTNALLYFRHMNLQPQSVVDYYRGSEEEFAMPRTYGSMLEIAHMHLPMMAMVLLLLTHLCIFLPWSLRLRVTLVLATFGCGLLMEGAGWLVRFVHPGFAWLKVGAFVGLQGTLALLLLGLGLYLARRPQALAFNDTLKREDGATPQRGVTAHATRFQAQR
ncbi:MAG: hypothetical protein JSW67_04505 [Candidatus Latescibacterota bacterium]|nr:MAG: hypothetical protein JSW67_04505 [Candidatus Latescibacterota bacterium]